MIKKLVLTFPLMIVGALTTFTLLQNPTPAKADMLNQTCWCKIVRANSNGSVTDIMSLDTGLTFHTLVPTSGDRGDCRNACGALYDSNKQAIADAACNANMTNDSDIRALWYIGTQNSNQVRQQSLQVHHGRYCPPAWMSNTNNQYGGATQDNRCKKEFAITGTNPPLANPVTPPPNGTPIGNWGFYWNGAMVAYGTAANGGAPGPETPNLPKYCAL